MLNNYLKFIFINICFVILTSSLLLSPNLVKAADSCTAIVSPNSVISGTQQSFSFTVTNTGDANVIYIRVTRPSSNFTLYNNNGVPNPWLSTISTSQAELYNGTISNGGSLSFNIGSNIGSEAASANWTIEIVASGDFVMCSGTLGTTITVAGDTTGPSLSQPTVSNITNSTSTISWTTDESSDSTVNYGKTLSYGSTLNNESLVTTHSLTLTGLDANTTYYYTISSEDASGNSNNATGYNFTTASANTTTTTTATATPRPVATATPAATTAPTAAPKSFVDNIDPEVKLTTDFSNSFEESPLIEGTAEDANSSLSEIEYSIDGGENWQPVDDTDSSNVKSASFSFTPKLSEDGNYQIMARASDSLGNIGETEISILIIDRLPPRVGGNLLYLGPHPLLPNEDGIIVTMAGLAQKITLSAVGGPTSIDLLANERIFSLGHSSQTGLWTGTIIFNEPGIYQLKTRAIDGAGNKTERNLNTVLVMRSGLITTQNDKALKNAKITVYYQNQESNAWSLWDGKAFSQENPQNIDENGEYEFFLPAGVYYLEVSSPGYQTLTTKIFKIEESTPFNADFELKKATGISIGPFTFAMPKIFIEQADVVIKSPKIPESITRPYSIGQEIDHFSLPIQSGNFDTRSLKGDKAVITFVSSWSPPAIEQISAIDQAIYDRELNAHFVTTQETPSKILIFLERGGYRSEIAVDRDGDILEDYPINSLPVHYFLDRTGAVEKVVTGVLNVSEMKEILDNIS